MSSSSTVQFASNFNSAFFTALGAALAVSAVVAVALVVVGVIAAAYENCACCRCLIVRILYVTSENDSENDSDDEDSHAAGAPQAHVPGVETDVEVGGGFGEHAV